MTSDNNSTKSSLFDNLMSETEYLELLSQLPEDERPYIQKMIKDILDRFERNIIIPLQNYNDK